MLGFLLSLLAGRGAQASAKPGTSLPLQYPVLLFGEGRILVMDTVEKLTSTQGSSGLYYPSLQLIDAAGNLHRIVKAREFGRKSWVLDMGTGTFHVHLVLKRLKTLKLAEARKLLLELVSDPESSWSRWPGGSARAVAQLESCNSLGELMEECRRSWDWH
ncbi:hypothetical protein [Paludibaculum fermentans]|uniref:Uncharacterized protein n=1 Tax=Paludibaculum fermentans TaxID=1473598 RepID=A0A7S7NS21_PALFE|nr:hypothetical protein [Paludibaculum fermentans]QOY88708.1 hypothetical protein IRI77_01730 [Paludibaculum fermentans]